MDWIKKNKIMVSISMSVLGLLAALFLGFNQMAFSIVPKTLQNHSNQMCEQQLDAKSYQLKQFILENINNSKIWAENRKDFFFDTRWFAISLYEHDGREWLLKDFKMNSVVLDVYKIVPSDYIKLEQTFVSPHPQSEQINIQYGTIQSLPLVVIDVANTIRSNPKNHMIRISMFSDLVTSVLSSDSLCTLDLLTTRGNFIFNSKPIDKEDFLSKMQNFSGTNPMEKQTFESSNFKVVTKKLLKNLYAVALVSSTENTFKGAFIQFLFINGIAAIILFFLFLNLIRRRFKNRISYFENNILELSKNKPQVTFDLTKIDELTILDERISAVSEDLKRIKD